MIEPAVFWVVLVIFTNTIMIKLINYFMSTGVNMEQITKEEYRSILAETDWYYEYAEGSTYYAGKKSYDKAVQYSRQNDEFRQMFAERYERAFSKR